MNYLTYVMTLIFNLQLHLLIVEQIKCKFLIKQLSEYHIIHFIIFINYLNLKTMRARPMSKYVKGILYCGTEFHSSLR